MAKHFGTMLRVVFCISFIQSSHQASGSDTLSDKNCDCADSYVCKNGGRLDLTDHSVSCVCEGPYSGERCELYMCKNGGTAMQLIDGSYICACTIGFYGKTCQQKDHCSCEPCENGGTCRNTDDGFICDCRRGYSGDRCQNLGKDCSDIKATETADKPTPSGVYDVLIGSQQTQVYCDMRTDGGWTVIQRRVSDDVDFYRNWTEYERGFGDLNANLWIGNSIMNLLTSTSQQILRVELTDWEGNSRYAEYSSVQFGNSTEKYSLKSLGKYSGDAGDSLEYHLRMKFTTFDQDNDFSGVNCALTFFKGGWWYNSCLRSNLNGEYKSTGSYTGENMDGVTWNGWRGGWYSYKRIQMMLKSATSQ